MKEKSRKEKKNERERQKTCCWSYGAKNMGLFFTAEKWTRAPRRVV
jgi:hypothetical protein